MVFISIYVKKDLCLKKLPPYFLFSIILYLWSEQVCENTCYCLVFGVFSSCIWSKVSGKALAFRLCTIIKGFLITPYFYKEIFFIFWQMTRSIPRAIDGTKIGLLSHPPVLKTNAMHCTLTLYVNLMTINFHSVHCW